MVHNNLSVSIKNGTGSIKTAPRKLRCGMSCVLSPKRHSIVCVVADGMCKVASNMQLLWLWGLTRLYAVSLKPNIPPATFGASKAYICWKIVDFKQNCIFGGPGWPQLNSDIFLFSIHQVGHGNPKLTLNIRGQIHPRYRMLDGVFLFEKKLTQ